MFHAVRRTDMKLTVAFRNLVAAPDKKSFWLLKCATKVILQSLPSVGTTAVTRKGETHKQAFQGGPGVNTETIYHLYPHNKATIQDRTHR